MGYRTTNAAFAYDMQPQPYPEEYGYAAPAGERRASERPSFDVVAGAGLEADQQTSPVFLKVVKTLCVLVAVFVAVGLVRVSIASATAATLNANAALTNTLETNRDTSSDLEVMRSVYGSDSRIRDIAAGTLGMVDAEQTVTLDFSSGAKSSSKDASDASQVGHASNANNQ